MEFEFEGRTEKEAIDRAAGELGLEKDDFDVEILETQKSGLFKKGLVKIKVHVADFGSSKTGSPSKGNRKPEYESKMERERIGGAASQAVFGEPAPQNEFEQKMIDFCSGLIERMGYPGTVSILFREKHKLGMKIDSTHSSILIGKKGKNLDALQLLLNIYAGRLGKEETRVILDTENYRIRREESLVRLAYNVAEKVRENKGSVLLEPMNPFDRWLIHTTLNDIGDVETKSEGDGLYKQVRVFYRGLR
ncbi:MAG: protein jag [Treponema sp.]|nr:protein jag [Treponema sp.]MCL2237080.1 protein jag [Treponema sp.]